MTLATSQYNIIRIFKVGTLNPAEPWVNTYELVGNADGVAGLQAVAANLLTFERALHYSDVRFLRTTISTWIPDSHPYNPFNFAVVEHAPTVIGTVDADNTLASDRDIVLAVKRSAETGRSGKIFYRGCLTEGDFQVTGSGNKMTLQGGVGAAINTRFNTAKAGISGLLDGGLGDFYLAMLSNTESGGMFVRPVIDLSIQKITINQSNHRYFDVA